MSTIRARSAIAACVAISLLAPAWAGCAMQRQRINIENAFTRLERVKIGDTRAEELPAILGSAPANILPVRPDKEAWIYSFGDSKTFMLGIIILNFQKTNTGIDNAVIVVDRNGVVEDIRYSSYSRDLSWQFWPFGGD